MAMNATYCQAFHSHKPPQKIALCCKTNPQGKQDLFQQKVFAAGT